MGEKKHVTSACMNCRRRKVKCDGNEICANCAVANLSCEYNAEADMRKVSAKKVISDLRSRVAQLENTLRQHGIREHTHDSAHGSQSPMGLYESGAAPDDREDGGGTSVSPNEKPRPDARAGTHASASISPLPLGAATDTTPNRHQIAVTFDTTTKIGENQKGPSLPAHSLFDLVADDRLGKADDEPYLISNNRGSSSPAQSPNIGNHIVSSSIRELFKSTAMASSSNVDSSQDGGEDASIGNLLAARMGSLRIAEDGQMRYYGPTSNLHVQTEGSHFLSQSKIRQVATEGAGVLRSLGLDRAVPVEMEIHLAKLYFTWEDPNVHTVDEEIYFQEKQQWVNGNRVSSYYSETLNNAICAIGASLAVDEDLGFADGRASEFFSARAKAMLEIEMDSPTIATVQALIVMSASEAALTRDARGWLYSGMAARLSADLGLHLDVTKHRNSGILTERDWKMRATTFWGVFILEVMWSLYIGRPSGLGVRTICIERPDGSLDAVNARMWKPYPQVPGQSLVPDEGVFFPALAITDFTITQCQFTSKINTTLYSGRTIAINGLMEFLIQTRKELYEWHDNIHDSLKVDLTHPTRLYIPAVLQLHMQFYALMITLYRPYLSTTLGRQENDLVSEEARAVLRNVSSDCIAAARHVTDYLRCYQRQHTFTRSNIQVVHITFTASLIFIYDICSQTNQQSWASQRDLQFCTDILGQLGRCFGNAHRALEVIILIKHQWWQMSAARRARTQAAKRDSGNMSGGDSWGDEELKTGGGSLRDSMDRSKRRYSPAVPEAAQQSFANPPSSSPFQPFEQYPQQGAFHLDFGIEQQTPLENSHNLFMDETELYFNDMSGRMEWFDQAQFYPPDGSTNSHGTR